MSLPYNQELISRARELRKNMTEQERHLWYCFLKEYPVRFQRQKVIGSYIVDFYCHRAKIAIEIDGSQHYEPSKQRYDKQRTEYLKTCKIQVLRFSNREINTSFDSVCDMIDQTVNRKLKE